MIMPIQKKCAWITCTMFAYTFLFAITDASAGNLPCIQRLIDWNNANTNNYVSFTAVTLHSPSLIATYTQRGELKNASCYPISGPNGMCLYGINTVDTLSSNRTFSKGFSTQPFDASRPIKLTIDSIPVHDFYDIQIHQAQGSYTFTPVCAGNLLIGTDQYSNHWTMSFSMYTASVIR
ncbi:exported hypothetical protein [Crenothrix polyspora]|jgi:hypothetical protein|uniref:Secreted protein n=1 Tax=Crenothrix polyspora TaxID=360316 RepID=A0A1R4H3K3_9GAMM|nr:exported hypothetical protein [Crenothrix polyspora]